MTKDYHYVSLIAMLPKVEPLFASKRPPLSRIRLDTLLRNLEPEDAADIEFLVQTIEWFSQKLEFPDEAFIHNVKKRLESVRNENIYNWIIWRLNFRGLLVALRLKQQNKNMIPLGFCSLQNRIEKHWHEPAFGLDKQILWLAQARTLLANEQALALEKLILDQVWQWLEMISIGHEFDLEAVAIYRMRWDLVNRWTSYQQQDASPKLDQLLEKASQKLDVTLDWNKDNLWKEHAH